MRMTAIRGEKKMKKFRLVAIVFVLVLMWFFAV